MANKRENVDVLYLDKNDVLLSSWKKNPQDLTMSDFIRDVQEDMKLYPIVIYSHPKQKPVLIKSRW